MTYDCNECANKIKSDKFFYCEECSTCTNGEVEDTNNNFVQKIEERNKKC